MERGRRPSFRLTCEQQRLVRENIGLVGVHLRRYVSGAFPMRLGRDWNDLFQEGCLGLIRAAADYDAGRGVPFAAFAFSRIHHAVSRALRTGSKNQEIGAGERRPAGKRKDPHPYHRPEDEKLLDLEWAEPRRADPSRTPYPTVAERIREKYEQAVRSAARLVIDERCIWRDRGELVRLLVEERLMVPQEEARHCLRQIAQQTGSSYGRVVECERRLVKRTRKLLEVDAEFQELQLARRAEGGKLPIDELPERPRRWRRLPTS